jgi:hypothetical protein
LCTTATGFLSWSVYLDGNTNLSKSTLHPDCFKLDSDAKSALSEGEQHKIGFPSFFEGAKTNTTG